MTLFNMKCMMISILVTFAVFTANAADQKDGDTAKRAYRIGYIEAGDFWAFPKIMDALKAELEQSGLEKSVEFPEDARYSPGWGPDNEKKLNQSARKLMDRNDIDLIISAGTPATRAILNVNNGKTPIMGIGVSDPLRSGFIKDEKDSGTDNFTVRLAPGRFKRMFSIFHDVVGFKKLGLMHYDTKSGRFFSSVDDAYAVAKERGFDVIEYTKVKATDDHEACLEGLKWLVDQGIDAFFQPAITCFDWNNSDVKLLLDFLIENKIPTFAREGSVYVKAGALMGFSSIDFKSRGKFLAEKVIQILKGASPRSLPMIDKTLPKISFNLNVAEKIGFQPPFDILEASDEVFDEIILPAERLKKE